MSKARAASRQAAEQDLDTPTVPTVVDGPLDTRWGNAAILEQLMGMKAQADRAEPLPTSLKARAEQSLNISLNDVKVHTGPTAAKKNTSTDTQALTIGDDIFLGPGLENDENHVLLHELGHVGQQQEPSDAATGANPEAEAERAAEAIVHGQPTKVSSSPHGEAQPYESHEHAELGDGAAGAKIFLIQGISVTSGELNALADFYESPEAVLNADPKELNAVVQLIRQEREHPESVTADQWQAATNGRYLKMAEKNDEHFALHNESILPGAPEGGEDHASRWHSLHLKALGLAAQAAAMATDDPAREETITKARIINAFADHYLSDAFSAGHLFNKSDAMHRADQTLQQLSDQSREAIFADVAARTFSVHGDLIRQYDGNKLGFWLEMNSADRFQVALERAYKKKPDAVQNALVIAAHDKLNGLASTKEGGVLVINDYETNPWGLSGDGSLSDSEKTKNFCEKAIAASRVNVEAVYALGAAADQPALAHTILGYIPQPTEEGLQTITSTLDKVMDPEDGLADAMVTTLNKQMATVLEEMVKEAPESFRRRPGTATNAATPGATSPPNRDVTTPEGADKELPPHPQWIIVKAGDTLSGLAERYYQDGGAWGTIHDANADQVPNPDLLQPGWRLLIPATPQTKEPT